MGTPVKGKEKFGSVESVKAVSEIYSPISGEVVETNSSLSDAPETVSDPSLSTSSMHLSRRNLQSHR